MFRNLIFIEENIGFDRILKSILIAASHLFIFVQGGLKNWGQYEKLFFSN